MWWPAPSWWDDDDVAYFTAVMARSGATWKARDVELDEGASLEELGDALRICAVDDEPVIALLEHEDEWFALFRVDADDDPRLFVSDLPAASRSGYADLLESAAEVRLTEEVDAGGAEDADDDEDEDDPDEKPAVVTTPWGGDLELLDDLGVAPTELRRVVEEHDDDPAGALADLGERLGFGELIEALR